MSPAGGETGAVAAPGAELNYKASCSMRRVGFDGITDAASGCSQNKHQADVKRTQIWTRVPSVRNFDLLVRTFPVLEMVTIERRPYGADMTPEERSTLLSRVYVLEPGIVFYREVPMQSVESIDLMLGRLYELGCQWPTFIEVLDLSKVERPSPAVRAVIRGWMLRLAPRMAHMCVIVETNFVMRAVARFVAYSMNITELSFYETEAEAIDAARRLRG